MENDLLKISDLNCLLKRYLLIGVRRAGVRCRDSRPSGHGPSATAANRLPPSIQPGLFIRQQIGLACLECEMFLGKIAERNHDGGGENFRDGRIQSGPFDEKFNKNVVQSDTDGHQHKITEELNASPQFRIGENDVTVHKESAGETDAERKNKSRDIRFQRNETQVHHLFMKQKVIGERKYRDVDYRIESPTCRIPESLDGHQFAKRRVKKVYEGNDVLF